MNTKIAVFFVVCLLFAVVGLTHADWLDDLNEGTSQVVSAVNENAGKINTFATNINILGKILGNLDPDSNEQE
ncbi:unnamed protein product [Ceratitis capitata]|uniref:(Mediterranean fruit fly) hypothetical protein n=1 Tax=Ceratitis capitata TaxID=7213 RepID=A0A811TZF3_CERCA|nr:unnamed protein product [Ceratitis capitata]